MVALGQDKKNGEDEIPGEVVEGLCTMFSVHDEQKRLICAFRSAILAVGPFVFWSSYTQSHDFLIVDFPWPSVCCQPPSDSVSISTGSNMVSASQPALSFQQRQIYSQSKVPQPRRFQVMTHSLPFYYSIKSIDRDHFKLTGMVGFESWLTDLQHRIR